MAFYAANELTDLLRVTEDQGSARSISRRPSAPGRLPSPFVCHLPSLPCSALGSLPFLRLRPTLVYEARRTGNLIALIVYPHSSDLFSVQTASSARSSPPSFDASPKRLSPPEKKTSSTSSASWAPSSDSSYPASTLESTTRTHGRSGSSSSTASRGSERPPSLSFVAPDPAQSRLRS